MADPTEAHYPSLDHRRRKRTEAGLLLEERQPVRQSAPAGELFVIVVEQAMNPPTTSTEWKPLPGEYFSAVVRIN